MRVRCSKVLVTGGAGFIGSHIVERLLDSGLSTLVLDSLEKGRFKNIAHHVGKKSFHFVKGDIRDFNVIKEVLKEVDGVVHLAALTSPAESFEKPSLYNEVNITGTMNLLNACLDSGVKRFVYASSAALYGHAECLPIKENSPLRPTSPYGISKMAAEAYVRLFFEEYGLETVSLRYFNVYGPRQPNNQYSGVITQFINCLRANRSLVIFGDGKQTRDFVNIKDVTEASILALARNGVAGEIFNIGTGVATPINDLAKTLLEIEGKTGLKTVCVTSRKGDIEHSVADISKGKEKLGYLPRIQLKRGLRELVKTQAPVRARTDLSSHT